MFLAIKEANHGKGGKMYRPQAEYAHLKSPKKGQKATIFLLDNHGRSVPHVVELMAHHTNGKVGWLVMLPGFSKLVDEDDLYEPMQRDLAPESRSSDDY